MQKSKLTTWAEVAQIASIPTTWAAAWYFQSTPNVGGGGPSVTPGLIFFAAAVLNTLVVLLPRLLGIRRLKPGFVFYEGRGKQGKIEELLKHGGRLHVITHVGGNIVNLQMLEKDSVVDRLILQDPDGDEIKFLAAAVSDRDESELREQIKLSISRAKKSGIKTKIFDAPMSSVILGKAGNGGGWAHVEVFLPQVDARHRPSLFLKESAYPIAFKNLEKMFDETWNIARDA